MRPRSEPGFGSPMPSASMLSPSSPPVSTRSVRVRIVPSLCASMKSVSPVRSRPPFLRFLPVLSRVRNQRQAGIPVVRKSWAGSATMQSTRSASTIRSRISPSPPEPVESEPLAMTKPATPPPRPLGGARWWMKCWIQRSWRCRPVVCRIASAHHRPTDCPTSPRC